MAEVTTGSLWVYHTDWEAERADQRIAFPLCTISNGCICLCKCTATSLAWSVRSFLTPRRERAHDFGSAPLFYCQAQEEEKKKNGTTEQKHIPKIRHL